jgi:hypothetical protein
MYTIPLDSLHAISKWKRIIALQFVHLCYLVLPPQAVMFLLFKISSFSSFQFLSVGHGHWRGKPSQLRPQVSPAEVDNSGRSGLHVAGKLRAAGEAAWSQGIYWG